MGFDAIITGGTVVTASDTSQADVAISGGRVVALGSSLPRENATRLIDVAGMCSPAESTSIPIWICPSSTSADDFETGTRPPLSAAPRQ